MQRLGQHFLKNASAITRIIDALNLQRGEAVIEIGPGSGALTIPLAEMCARARCTLIAIEKDALLVHKLISLQADKLKNVDVVRGDALKELPGIVESLFGASTRSFGLRPQDDDRETAVAFKIVGNIPYYITGALLRVIGELEHKPTRTVLMVQREVAERVVAQPPQMNLLAAATQIWADTELLFALPPEDFDPPPKVKSGVIKLKVKSGKFQVGELASYYKFIHVAFKQPRKTLLNNLDGKKLNVESRKEEILQKLQQFGYTEKTRAQELSTEQLVALSRVF